MGSLTYGGTTVEFDDRLLAHLQIVVVNKLRRHDGFVLSWRDGEEMGGGRSAIWLDPSTPVYFTFDGSRVPGIDRDWLRRLADSADSSTGLVAMDESGHAMAAGRRSAARLGRQRERRFEHA